MSNRLITRRLVTRSLAGILGTSGGGNIAAFTDTFIRANSVLSASATASGGGTWTSGPGAFDDCQIVSNQLGGNGGTSGARILTTNSGGVFGADQKVFATLGVGGSGVDSIGIMVRMQSAVDGSGYLMFVDSATQLTIYKVVDSGSITPTPIGASYTVTTLVAGDIIGLQIVGTTLQGYVNGVALPTTRTDATYSTGMPGVYYSADTHFISLITAANAP